MRTIIAGDIHGKVEVVEMILAQPEPSIFVGDIADSFDRPTAAHILCFDLIFKAIDEGKSQCLYGNHELSYLMARMRCSGWNASMAAHVNGGLRHEMGNRFTSFLLYEPNILITHAGLDKTIWDEFHLSLDNLAQTLAEWTVDESSPAYRIGRSRGGSDRVGGIFWCDFHREHTPIPELIQVVGHTRGRGLRVNGTTTCVDFFDYNAQACDLFYMELPDGNS